MKPERTSPFHCGTQTLTVISTDLAEPEALIRQLAGETKKNAPHSFAGKDPCIYFRFLYAAPCENFRDLRKLILRVREGTGLRANFKGIVALEATEWLGHEQEEYFQVMLKYLYDQRDCWHSVMVLKNCSEAKLNRFLGACVQIITPIVSRIPIFSDPEQLKVYLEYCLRGKKRSIDQKGLGLLSDALTRPELAPIRSLALLERAVGELIRIAPEQSHFTETTVRQYLERNGTLLAMMRGDPILTQRRVELYEAV